MYNPESFTRSLKVNYQCRQVPGDPDKEMIFQSIDEGDVTFKFLFDATGASTNSKEGRDLKAGGSVTDHIGRFHQATYMKDPQAHQNNFLQLSWGEFSFYCRLLNSKVDYTLFDPQGKPLRATIEATFTSVTPREKQKVLDAEFSADLTHVYQVKAGETIHLISEAIYGDPRYYLEIARVNRLKNFRSLKPGMELVLPPIDKREQ